MQSKVDNNLIFIRLFEDEDINEELKEVCKKYEIKTAIVISAIGQIKRAVLGYFKEKGNYAEEVFEKPLEILSLNGNIVKEKNDYILHLHAVLGDERKNTFGGHFISGKVGILAEIVLVKTDINAYREYDNKTGLKLLFFK